MTVFFKHECYKEEIFRFNKNFLDVYLVIVLHPYLFVKGNACFLEKPHIF